MMMMVIASTDKVEFIDGVQCRVWEGRTADGIACKVLVHRVAVDEADDQLPFLRELVAKPAPMHPPRL